MNYINYFISILCCFWHVGGSIICPDIQSQHLSRWTVESFGRALHLFSTIWTNTCDPCIFSISGHRYKWQNKYLINSHYTSLMMSGECQMALCTINIKVKHCFENVHVVSLWSLRLLMFHAIWLWMLHLNINRNVTSNDVIPLCFVGSSLHTFSLQFIRKANWTICVIGNHANCCGLESSFFSIFISNPNSTWMNNKRLLENNNVSRDTL